MRLALPLTATLVCSLATASVSQTSSFDLSEPGSGTRVRADAHGRRATVTLGATATSSPVSAPAPVANWQSLGPFGGDVDSVAASPTSPAVVLAGLAPSGGGGGSLFRSTDAGASWTEVLALAGTSVHDVEFASDGTAWIGTIDGVQVSADDGLTWTPSPLGIGLNDQVLEVTIDPADDDRIWIGIADALGSQPVNVMLSTDGGTSWSDRTPPLAAAQGGRGIAVDPNDSNAVVAAFGGGFGGGAVWVSADGGLTWADRSAGLPGNPMNDAAHDGNRILVAGGQLFGSQNVGLYASSNGGVTWTPLFDGTWPILVVHDVEVDPANPAEIWCASAGAGLYHSTNGGTSWTIGAGGTGSLSVNEVRAAGGSNLFLGASSTAVWKSSDGGATFAPSSAGIGGVNAVSIAANPLDPDELAIAFQGQNDGGVMTSTDGGANWTIEGTPSTRFEDVAFAFDGTLHAISDGPTTIAPEGLYRRSGGVWTSIGPDQGPQFESELVVATFSRYDPQLIMAAGADFGVAGFQPTIWRSPDAGATWTKVYEGPVDNEDVQDVLIADDGTDQTMVAAYTDFGGPPQTGGALRSADGGVTWASSSTGLPIEVQGNSLCASPTDPDVVWLADSDVGPGLGGVHVSADAGQSWSPVNGTLGSTRRIACDPNDDQTLFVTTFSQPYVRVSDDAGATFAPFDAGLAGSGFPRDLHITEGGGRLLLGTSLGSFATPLFAEPVIYCTAKANSLGCTPQIGSSGVPSASAPAAFNVTAAMVLNNRNGLFFYGIFGRAALPFQGGTLCVMPPLRRTPIQNSLGNPPPLDCSGAYTFDLNAWIQGGNDPNLGAGITLNGQHWTRDPASSFGTGLSDAIEVTVGP